MTRVALFGPYHSHNLGDTATQVAVMQSLRDKHPKWQLVGVSSQPSDTLASLNLPAFPLSGGGSTAGDLSPFVEPPASSDAAQLHPCSLRSIFRIARFLRTVDILVVSGGGQLDDFWGGAWNHPWSMFLWTALARMRGIKVVYLGVGVDGLRHRLSRVFCSFAMRWAHQRSFRDAVSRQTMRDMGMRAPSEVCPDVAFALNIDALVTKHGIEPCKAPFVVISPIAQKTWTEQPMQQHQNYMSALMNLGIEMAGKGYAIRLACSQTEMDKEEAKQLLLHLSAAGVPEVALCDIQTVGDFIAQVRGADLVIASRLHGVILSLIAGCPVIGIAHLGKVTEVMKEFSLEEYCVSLQSLDEDVLRTRVLDALNRRDSLRQIVTTRVGQNAKRLETVFGGLSS